MPHFTLRTVQAQPGVDIQAVLEELERVGLAAYDARLDWVAGVVMQLAGIIRAQTDAMAVAVSRVA